MNRIQEEIDDMVGLMMQDEYYAQIVIGASNTYLGMAHTELDEDENEFEFEKEHLHFLDKADEKWEDKKNS